MDRWTEEQANKQLALKNMIIPCFQGKPNTSLIFCPLEETHVWMINGILSSKEWGRICNYSHPRALSCYIVD